MQIRFDSITLAIGANARVLTCKGADENVLYLRSIEDVRSLKAAAEKSARYVVVGGGFIGLEVASSLVQQQERVTIVEAIEQVLSRASPEVSTFLSNAQTQHGVQLLTRQSVDSFTGENGRVRSN